MKENHHLLLLKKKECLGGPRHVELGLLSALCRQALLPRACGHFSVFCPKYSAIPTPSSHLHCPLHHRSTDSDLFLSFGTLTLPAPALGFPTQTEEGMQQKPPAACFLARATELEDLKLTVSPFS